jgi:hypothetical protein
MTRKGFTVRTRGNETTALPELERMLAGTAAAQRRGRRGLPRPRHVAALGLACMALGGTAVAADIWNPAIGTDVPSAPSIATTAVPTELTEALGVLRRDPNAQDRGPEVEKTLTTVSDDYLAGLRPDSVRYLEPLGDHDEAVILFSAESSVFTDGEVACISIPNGEGVGSGPAGAECLEPNQILSGDAVSVFERLGKNGYGEAFGLVPDGVVSGTAEFPSGLEIEVPVTENYFKFEWDSVEAGTGEDSPGEERYGPTRIVWHDPSGELVYQPPR